MPTVLSFRFVVGDVSLNRILAAPLLAALTCSAGPAFGQHATGADIESGANAYSAACATCHGPDGNLIAGIDFSRGLFRRPLTDDEIVAIIRNGIPNTPMPPMAAMSDEQAREIVAYLRSLPDTLEGTDATGDPARGRELVTGRGECLDCHRIGVTGSHLGPDLNTIGRDRRAVEIERSLVAPQDEIQPSSRFVRIVPKRGEPVTGRLLNQDSFTVQLFDEDERLRSFDKSALETIEFVESPMPSYRDRLDPQALADVVSYLVTLRGDSER